MTGIRHQQRQRHHTFPGALWLAGAVLAGAGAGAIIWWNLGPIGWSLVIIGLVSFVLGRVGAAR